MSNKRFSSPNQAPTQFERDLLASADPEASSWVRLGQRIGAEAMCILLDEVGGDTAHLPVRRDFFPRLYRNQRDAEIRALDASKQLSTEEIASRCGVSPPRVRQLRMKPGKVRRKHRRATANRGT